MIVSYKYRIYPTSKQIAIIERQLDICRWLYNTALEHRISAYKSAGISISYKDQQNELPSIKEQFPEFKGVHSQVLQNILRRIDGSFQNFFRRVKRSEKPGFPRFKGKDRFDSICYPQSGFRMVGNRVELSRIGNIKIKLHRATQGNIKTCTLKKSGSQWFVIFTSEITQATPERPFCCATGIDLGLESFATLSNGEKISNPRYLEKSEERLKEIQSKYSRKKTRTAKRKLLSLQRKVSNQRNDFLHKMSRVLVSKFDLIAYEDLNIKQMVEGKHAKSIHDAGWGKFIDMLKYKAESAGAYAISVNPYHTSQICSNCGRLVKKEIHQRWHDCHECGLSIHRDHNAAINILKSGTDAVFQMPFKLAEG